MFHTFSFHFNRSIKALLKICKERENVEYQMKVIFMLLNCVLFFIPVTSVQKLQLQSTFFVVRLAMQMYASLMPKCSGTIYSPAEQLVRFSHPNVPFFPNSEFI